MLANILKSKIDKELSFGLGKIIIEALPKVPLKNLQMSDCDNDSTMLSINTPQITPLSSPKNTLKVK